MCLTYQIILLGFLGMLPVKTWIKSWNEKPAVSEISSNQPRMLMEFPRVDNFFSKLQCPQKSDQFEKYLYADSQISADLLPSLFSKLDHPGPVNGEIVMYNLL